MPGNYRELIVRANANNNNAEIKNNFYWSLDMVNAPRGVYYPGNQLFYQRLINVTGLPEYSHSVNDIEVAGGFHNLQPGGIEHGGASLTLTFQDYIDQSIEYFWKDYMDKVDDPETRLGLPKSQLVMDMDVYQLDSQLRPIKKFIMRTGLGTSLGTGEDFGTQKSSGGKVTVGVQFEWWDIKHLNK